MVNNNVAYQQYQKVQVETANKGSLLLMLYQGCIKFLRLSVKSIEDKNYEDANRYLIRSQDIIFELINTLDREQGGDIANNLYNLYDFMISQLVQANISKDIAIIKNVEGLMVDLLGAWQQIIKP